MRLTNLQDRMLLPDREILLNRSVTVGGTEMLLISITSENGVHKLWVLSRLPERLPNEEQMEEEGQELNEQYMDSVASTCSEHQVLALLEYESEDDIQLNFYAQDYLDTKPLPASRMTSMHWFFKSDREVGPHGLKSRVSLIDPVDRTFEGRIIVELMSYYEELPEKLIEVMKNSQ